MTKYNIVLEFFISVVSPMFVINNVDTCTYIHIFICMYVTGLHFYLQQIPFQCNDKWCLCFLMLPNAD